MPPIPTATRKRDNSSQTAVAMGQFNVCADRKLLSFGCIETCNLCKHEVGHHTGSLCNGARQAIEKINSVVCCAGSCTAAMFAALYSHASELQVEKLARALGNPSSL
jgi:hypothetical protein